MMLRTVRLTPKSIYHTLMLTRPSTNKLRTLRTPTYNRTSSRVVSLFIIVTLYSALYTTRHTLALLSNFDSLI